MGPALGQSSFSRTSPGRKEPQKIVKTMTLGPKDGPRSRTTKLAAYPTSSSNGTI